MGTSECYSAAAHLVARRDGSCRLLVAWDGRGQNVPPQQRRRRRVVGVHSPRFRPWLAATSE